MTRKDFILIAQTLAASKPTYEDTNPLFNKNAHRIAMLTWSVTCNNFANTLATTNNLFDRNRFLIACGYTESIDLDARAFDYLETHLTPEL